MASKILVTGATGRTSSATIELLRKKGADVRALVHNDGPAADALRALGAEVVRGDLKDLDSVAGALSGIERAYFCYPLMPGLIEATAFFAQAAREASVKAIVNISQISARRVAKSHAARDHWIAERIFDWSGIPVTHLRPTFFAEWLINMVDRAAVRHEGVVRLPFASGRHAPIATQDQARLIAELLLNPAPHAGKTYSLHGPVEMDHHQIAAIFGKVLGRPMRYEPVTPDDWERDRLKKIGVSAHVMQHQREVTIDYQNGVFAGEDGIIAQVTGKRPMTVEEFLAEKRALFENA